MTTDYEQSGIVADAAGIPHLADGREPGHAQVAVPSPDRTYAGEHYRITGAGRVPEPRAAAPPAHHHRRWRPAGAGHRRLGGRHRRGQPEPGRRRTGPEVLATTTAEYYGQRIEWAGQQVCVLGFDQPRAPSASPSSAQIVPNRDEAIAQLAGALSVEPEQIEGSPVAMIGTTKEIAEILPDPSGPLRLLLRRGARGGDGGVRPGGGRARRYLGVGDPVVRIRHLRRHLRSHRHRPSRGGRGGEGAPGPRPDARWWPTSPGRRSGPGRPPGPGPLRHGRGGCGRLARARASRMEIHRGGP